MWEELSIPKRHVTKLTNLTSENQGQILGQITRKLHTENSFLQGLTESLKIAFFADTQRTRKTCYKQNLPCYRIAPSKPMLSCHHYLTGRGGSLHAPIMQELRGSVRCRATQACDWLFNNSGPMIYSRQLVSCVSWGVHAQAIVLADLKENSGQVYNLNDRICSFFQTQLWACCKHPFAQMCVERVKNGLQATTTTTKTPADNYFTLLAQLITLFKQGTLLLDLITCIIWNAICKTSLQYQ